MSPSQKAHYEEDWLEYTNHSSYLGGNHLSNRDFQATTGNASEEEFPQKQRKLWKRLRTHQS